MPSYKRLAHPRARRAASGSDRRWRVSVGVRVKLRVRVNSVVRVRVGVRVITLEVNLH